MISAIFELKHKLYLKILLYQCNLPLNIVMIRFFLEIYDLVGLNVV